MELVCELAQVSKSYDAHPVLRDFDLAVMRGEKVAITGKSGSGKSTLLNIIGLLETADEGRVSLFGQSAPKVGSARANRILRSRLGYLFQNFALIDGETVDHNLAVAQAYTVGSRAQKRKAREVALGSVGLAGLGGRRVFELSGGEQQRTAIARLMLKPCDLILADEPTGSLDGVNKDIVLGLIDRLNESGKTVIIVTHDEAVAARCGKTLRLPDPTVTS